MFIMYRYLWYAFFHPSATLHFSIVIFRSSWGKYILSAKKTIWIFCFPQYKCRLKISECRVPKASLDILDMETINKVDAQSHNWPSSNTLRGWGVAPAFQHYLTILPFSWPQNANYRQTLVVYICWIYHFPLFYPFWTLYFKVYAHSQELLMIKIDVDKKIHEYVG